MNTALSKVSIVNLNVLSRYITRTARYERLKHDLIGPPDPLSNLRPIKLHKKPNESETERTLRHLRVDTQEWNQRFWANHNQRFVKERERFLKGHNNAPTADAMSVFYKQFLDENWKNHVKYNLEWYKRNFKILTLSVVVNTQNILKKITAPVSS